MSEERTKKGEQSGKIGIACNLFLAVSKLVIGLMSGAVSIIADSVNNFSDAASSIISLIGFSLASQPADDEHPFGHARYEYISGLTIAFIVLLAGIELLKSSAAKVVSPEEVSLSPALFAVLVLSILVKAGMAVYNYRLGRKIGSTAVLAAALDSRNDVVTTSAVLLGMVLTGLTGLNLDGWIGILVSVFILIGGIGLLKDTSAPLLGVAPSPELVERVRKKIMSYDHVMGTHDLMLHDYGPGHEFGSVHVEMPASENVLVCHEIIDRIERDFLENEHIHMVIHYDPIDNEHEKTGQYRSYLAEQVKEIYPDITIHDLRIVPGEKNTNVIFDCVVPHTCTLSETQIRQEINSRLKKKWPDCTAIIKIDHSFVSLDG